MGYSVGHQHYHSAITSILINVDSKFKAGLKHAKFLLAEKRIDCESEMFRFRTRSGVHHARGNIVGDEMSDDGIRSRNVFTKKGQSIFDDCFSSYVEDAPIVSLGQRSIGSLFVPTVSPQKTHFIKATDKRIRSTLTQGTQEKSDEEVGSNAPPTLLKTRSKHTVSREPEESDIPVALLVIYGQHVRNLEYSEVMTLEKGKERSREEESSYKTIKRIDVTSYSKWYRQLFYCHSGGQRT